jgi:hypothetical protein
MNPISARNRGLVRALAALAVAACLVPRPASAGTTIEPFRPLTSEERALDRSQLDPDADAEILDWDVRIEDDFLGNSWHSTRWTYVRVKVFTEHGRDDWTRVDLLSRLGSDLRVTELDGRTLQPDGSEVKLASREIHERTIDRLDGRKVRVKSFNLPAVQVGSVIEARWKLVITNELTNYARLPFVWPLNENTPVLRVTYHVKPFSSPGLPAMRNIMFHGATEPMVHEADGFYRFSASNVRGQRDEPDMPPGEQIRPWMLLYYSDTPLEPGRYWSRLGKEQWTSTRDWFRTSADIKATAAQITAGDTTEQQRLTAIYDYCHRVIRNLDTPSPDSTTEERERRKSGRTASEVLKSGMGRIDDIDHLFGALAAAAGFEVRVLLMGRRDDMVVDPMWPDDYFLSTYAIAVKTGGEWQFYDPGNPFVECGMLQPYEESQSGLLTDPQEPTFMVVPASPASASCTRRTGAFKLAEDGTLEGEVRIETCGHAARDRKYRLARLSLEERRRDLVDRVHARMGDVEVSAVEIENATDPDRPVVEHCHVKIPGYAQVTGRRLFLQPAVFHKGDTPRYTDGTRRFPVMLKYAWSEMDTVLITPPDGFTVEKPEAPAPFRFGDFGRYDAALEQLADGRTLRLRRTFEFSRLSFDADEYPALKADFEKLQRRDAFTLVLARADAH